MEDATPSKEIAKPVADEPPLRRTDAVRHHVVSRFLLERFADPAGLVQVLHRRDLSPAFVATPDNILVHKNFYTADTNHGPDTAIEALLADHIEGPAARAIRRVVDERRPFRMAGLRSRMSMFFATQCCRGEWMRDAVNKMMIEDFRAVTRAITPESYREWHREVEGSEPDEDEVRKIINFAQNENRYRVQLTSEANGHLEMMLKTALDLVPYFHYRNWLLLEFDEPILVTGDEPVAVVGRSTLPGSAPIGIGTADEVVMALDSRHALVMVHPKIQAEERRYAGTVEMAAVVNANVAYGCHRFVVHRPGIAPPGLSGIPERGPGVVTGDDFIRFHRFPANTRNARRTETSSK